MYTTTNWTEKQSGCVKIKPLRQTCWDGFFSILEIYLFIASETSMLKKPHQMGVAFCFLVRSNATPYVSLNLSPVTS